MADDIIELTDGKIDPPYLQAVADALGAFTYGDTISFDWLYEHFELAPPTDGTYEDFQQFQFSFLSAMDGFRDELLVEHKMALHNLRGQGYLIVKPKDQTPLAMANCKKDLQKVMRRAAGMLQHIAMDLLTQEEAQENAEARARLAALRTFSRKTMPETKRLASQ